MRSLRNAIVAALIALPLGACVSLFPKDDPVQMYRFGAGMSASLDGAVQPGPAVGVLKLPTTFTRAAASDRILTVTGAEAAYIKDGRWAAPAAVLFDEAVARVFQGSGGPVRLITRGEVSQAQYVLKLDVRTFEARYDGGMRAAPEVVVETRAVLTRSSDRTLVGEQVFVSRARAGNNRMGAIALAFDEAVNQTLGELHAWVNQTT